MATITQARTADALTWKKHIHLKSVSSTVQGIANGARSKIPLPPPSTAPTEVLGIDRETLDSHVPRDPRLIRLTGVHPFNSEPPLTALYDEGFLTSPELFYVRNHGPVPDVHDQDVQTWEIRIEGLVERPMVLNMGQILRDFPQITAPVTLVCAGNRRKEQNTVRKSKGFSWGAAGLSTALFTGPLMAEILRSARPLRGAKYVCMEGADELPNGNYGTSVKLNWVMDPNKGIMLAHQMNGESLRPDHGRPLRVVVPGQIGGRSVKWLKRLVVTEKPSDNWYHIYDNRVLPTMVSPEMSSKDPKWWRDERYAIYDLNTNSVASFPQHNEELDLASAGPTYTAKGYAYSGGGRRVTRVEVSLDDGRTWRLSKIHYDEDRYRDFDGILFGGRVDMSWREACFCWCFWFLDIPVSDLKSSDAILVRAMDESMSVQPRDMYWSVLGMMNNPWFRVVIMKQDGSLKFEHPTHPAMSGGWMERVKQAGGDLANDKWGERLEREVPTAPEPVIEISMKRERVTRVINIDEVRLHAGKDQPWFVVSGEVYDGTKFLDGHPGGAQSIISSAGQDVSEDFLAIHSETAKAMMPEYHIGTLSEASRKILETANSQASTGLRETFLNPAIWSPATLVGKKTISQDTKIFTFQLEHGKQRLGLPVGQHVMLKLRDPSSSTNEAIIRSYTPISETDQEGTVDLLVKIYLPRATVQGGKMTMALDQLELTSTVEFKGPTGRFEYCGNGMVKVGDQERQIRSFKLICGGTGITPMLQVMRAVMQDTNDDTSCVIIDSNRHEEDILCKSELEAMESGNGSRCTVVHTLTRPSDTWMGRLGRVSADLLREFAPFEDDSMALICGPEGMEQSVREILLQQGWRQSHLHFF